MMLCRWPRHSALQALHGSYLPEDGVQEKAGGCCAGGVSTLLVPRSEACCLADDDVHVKLQVHVPLYTVVYVAVYEKLHGVVGLSCTLQRMELLVYPIWSAYSSEGCGRCMHAVPCEGPCAAADALLSCLVPHCLFGIGLMSDFGCLDLEFWREGSAALTCVSLRSVQHSFARFMSASLPAIVPDKKPSAGLSQLELYR